MKKVPLITSSKALETGVSDCLKNEQFNGYSLEIITDFESAYEFMVVELPELVFIDFSDKNIDSFGLLKKIMLDPWLVHGSIIGFYEEHEHSKKLENMQGINVIVTLNYGVIERQLPRVLSIIQENRRILFQRELGSDLVKNISGSFIIRNDPLELHCYVNLVCNWLYNSNKLDAEKKNNLRLALIELLINAVEHGNCGIDYDEKTRWLESKRDMAELIALKNQDPEVTDRKVTFEYSISSSTSKFIIIDEGDGFDWREIIEKKISLGDEQLHGRGIVMTRYVTHNLHYNEKGNEARFEIEYQDGNNLTPGLLQDFPPRDVSKGDIVFTQGESSNYLYFIVKGEYSVHVNDQEISLLTPDDIFMGEMSFLLNNMRSATVKAKTPGRLIGVSKKEFVEAIKLKPHYALFLARLLAQRINRLNNQSAPPVETLK